MPGKLIPKLDNKFLTSSEFIIQYPSLVKLSATLRNSSNPPNLRITMASASDL